MRGWLPLPMALLFLTLLPSAHAAALPAGPDGADAARGDVCVDATSALDDPTAVVIIAAQCTVIVSVSVHHTEDGRLVVTIVVAFAQAGYSCALEVTDLDKLPKVGDSVYWNDPCWRDTRWLT